MDGLGNWALIDIETTGVNPGSDSIIDVGFLQFEDTKLVRKYSSLVHFDGKLSYFISKLTGIREKVLKVAPSWESVEQVIQELYGHSLIGHNVDFERSFLQNSFSYIDDGQPRESYEDSLFFLGLLFPEKKTLKLEKFICDFGIADSEVHRGYEDSEDLLKVLLVAVSLVKQNTRYANLLDSSLKRHGFSKKWFYKFWSLSLEQLIELASEIDFNLIEILANYKKQLSDTFKRPEHISTQVNLEFSGENIKSILNDEKLIQKVLTGYSYREIQEKLALRVGQSFKNSVHSMIQAPTGTGKTFGYLLPALLYASQEKKKILLATGTKLLQEQLTNKDLPVMKQILGLDSLKISKLVGSKNHLCKLIFEQIISEEDLLEVDDQQSLVDLYFSVLFLYNSEKTSSKEYILSDDIPYSFKMKFNGFTKRLKEITVDFRSCSGKFCQFYDSCSYQQSLKIAKESDIIVGNHALMFNWPKGFPRPENIIIDEAHRIEKESTTAFSIEVTSESLSAMSQSLLHLYGIGSLFYLIAQFDSENATSLIEDIKLHIIDQQKILAEHLGNLPEMIEQYFKKLPKYTSEYWNEAQIIGSNKMASNMQLGIINTFESINYILSSVYEKLLPYVGRWELKNLKNESQISAFSRFESFCAQLDEIIVGIKLIQDGDDNFASSLKYHEEFGFGLVASPVNSGKILTEQVLNTSSSVVYLSATLANHDGSRGSQGIEWSTGYLYLEPEKRFKGGMYLPAVFDYKKNTQVFICDEVPSLYDYSFVPQIIDEIESVIRELEGKSLLLFSSKVRFETAREILIQKFEGEIPIFIQGMGNSVIEDFKNSGNGILLGMEAFGEGIDIPGETLQFLFIDKIPDLRMDLVINQRREFFEREFGGEFENYYLSTRSRLLHQKLGRLLRRDQDIGVSIVVDSRIKRWKGATWTKFSNLMQPYLLQKTDLKNACEQTLKFLKD